MCLDYDRHCGRPSWGWISREQCSTLTENIVFKCCTHPPWRPWDLMKKHCICIFSISKVKSVMQRHLNTAKLSFSQPVSDDILRNIRTAWLLGFPWVNRQGGKITWTIVGTSIWASLHSSYAVATRLLCCCYICCCYAIACCKTLPTWSLHSTCHRCNMELSKFLHGIVTWIWKKLLYVLTHYQTKPRWSLTQTLKLVDWLYGLNKPNKV